MESIKPLLMSLLTIGAVTIAGWTGTLAYFSDTETSSGNYFKAGSLDLKVDWVEYYNGEKIEEQPETDDPGPIFELDDVKPGDYGEATISLHVYDNDALVTMKVELTSNDEVSRTEPERDAGDEEEDPDDNWDGELAGNISVVIWWDMYDEGDSDLDGDGTVEYPGDNILDRDQEPIIYEGSLANFTEILDADPNTEEVIDPFKACTTYYVGFSWSILEDVGNIIQTDKCTFDITFTAEQYRHAGE